MGFQLKIVTYGNRFTLALNHILLCDIRRNVKAWEQDDFSQAGKISIQTKRQTFIQVSINKKEGFIAELIPEEKEKTYAEEKARLEAQEEMRYQNENNCSK